MQWYDEVLRREKHSVLTRDGSWTLFSKEFGESYHSDRDGALHESLEKHVKSAFRFVGDRAHLTILDICFGLGYNTLATLYYVRQHHLPVKLHIISPELDRGLVESLEGFEYPREFAAFGPIIEALSRDFYYEDEQFRIEILIGDARQIVPQIRESFDIIYQDAFSPRHNPLLWTREYFAQIRDRIRDDGVLTTYSIASAVRMGLHENGFNLFISSGDQLRDWTLASPQILKGLTQIDMVLKQERNPNARSLRDADFLQA